MKKILFREQNTAQVIETLKFVQKFCGQRLLIKIGGAPLQDPQLVRQLCEDFVYLRAAGISLVLVHGGGQAINQELTAKGFEWSFHNGLRVTSPQMMDSIEAALCGQVNGRIVRTLNAAGVHAVGLSGAAGLLMCQRLQPELGEVGTVQKVNADLVSGFLESQKNSMQGVIPVIAPLGVDDKGCALNVNADWAGLALAQALHIDKVIYLTDQDGLLDGQGQLVSEVDAAGLQELIDDGAVHGGMHAKVQTIQKALKAGIQQLHIINGSRPHALIEEVFTDQGVGTVCRSDWSTAAGCCSVWSTAAECRNARSTDAIGRKGVESVSAQK